MATSTFYGSYQNHRRVKMVVSYPTPALGATSVVVTVSGYLDCESSWDVSDSSNASSVTISGTSTSEGSTSFSGDGTQLFQTETKTVSISQTASTSVACSASLTGVETLGGDNAISASGTISIAATGVPYAHPSSIAFSSYNFAKGVSANTFVFTATGGASWGVLSTGTISGITSTAVTVTKSGQSIYVKLSDGQINEFLAAWNLATVTSSPTIIITTTATGLTNKAWPAITATIPSIKDVYTLSAFTATRSTTIIGGATAVNLGVTVTASPTSPFYQAQVWPGNCLPLKFYRNTLTGAATPATGHVGYDVRSYTGTTSTVLASSASGALDTNIAETYSALLYIGTTKYQQLSKVVGAYQSFIALRKTTVNTGKVGINVGAPTEALDVGGNLALSGNAAIGGQLTGWSHFWGGQTASTSVISGTAKLITLDNIKFDSLGEYAGGWFTAQKTGYYLVSWTCLSAVGTNSGDTSSDYWSTRVTWGSTGVENWCAGNFDNSEVGESRYYSSTVSTGVYLLATHKIGFQVYHNFGAAGTSAKSTFASSNLCHASVNRIA